MCRRRCRRAPRRNFCGICRRARPLTHNCAINIESCPRRRAAPEIDRETPQKQAKSTRASLPVFDSFILHLQTLVQCYRRVEVLREYGFASRILVPLPVLLGPPFRSYLTSAVSQVANARLAQCRSRQFVALGPTLVERERERERERARAGGRKGVFRVVRQYCTGNTVVSCLLPLHVQTL